MLLIAKSNERKFEIYDYNLYFLDTLLALDTGEGVRPLSLGKARISIYYYDTYPIANRIQLLLNRYTIYEKWNGSEIVAVLDPTLSKVAATVYKITPLTDKRRSFLQKLAMYLLKYGDFTIES